ncbi:MAG: hypothetical protein HQK77_18490, partial [Desulfobacterales bacterium]|nr:hypothetical protein [Desulfobacterales bacterium]
SIEKSTYPDAEPLDSLSIPIHGSLLMTDHGEQVFNNTSTPIYPIDSDAGKVKGFGSEVSE